MKSKFKRVELGQGLSQFKNNGSELSPTNSVGEYKFGYLCEKHYNKIKTKYGNEFDFHYWELLFDLAIKHGLTYEISTGDDRNKLKEIWDKVAKELKTEIDKD